MLALARHRVEQAEFLEADLQESLPLPSSAFDKVGCAQTLKHLPSLAVAFREFHRVLKPGGLLVFTVTHPEMDWEGYEMRVVPDFILSSESDIHHHPWSTYEDGLSEAGFGQIKPTPIRVSAVIEPLLLPESYRRVVGRPQILICTARSA
jgi:SAM-dependent methyltransferase